MAADSNHRHLSLASRLETPLRVCRITRIQQVNAHSRAFIRHDLQKAEADLAKRLDKEVILHAA